MTTDMRFCIYMYIFISRMFRQVLFKDKLKKIDSINDSISRQHQRQTSLDSINDSISRQHL